MSKPELLPAVGASGQWKLKEPFAAKYIPDLTYSCRAVRKLSEAVAVGEEVFERYYAPENIPVEVYEQHVKDDISLITLLSSTGNFIFVPMPYVDGWPSGDVVPYVVLGMAIELGAIPNTIDPTFLTPKVENVIRAALGHKPTITYVALSPVKNVDYTEHVQLETLRTTNITDENTDYVRARIAEENLAEAKILIKQLQDYIVSSGLIPPTP